MNDTILYDTGRVGEFVQKGAKFLVIDKNSFKKGLNYPVEYSGKNFIIYSLDNKP